MIGGITVTVDITERKVAQELVVADLKALTQMHDLTTKRSTLNSKLYCRRS